jgi:predicted transcriptional regulator
MKLQRQPSVHRDHWHNIRAALRFMQDYPDDSTYTRLLYVCRSTNKWMPHLLGEMEYMGLIKYCYEEREHGENLRQTIAITQKGRKVLELLDMQATMLSAKWTLENTQS